MAGLLDDREFGAGDRLMLRRRGRDMEQIVRTAPQDKRRDADVAEPVVERVFDRVARDLRENLVVQLFAPCELKQEELAEDQRDIGRIVQDDPEQKVDVVDALDLHGVGTVEDRLLRVGHPVAIHPGIVEQQQRSRGSAAPEAG